MLQIGRVIILTIQLVFGIEILKFRDILLDENSYEASKNILFYDMSYKNSVGTKPLGVRFNKIDGFIKIHDISRYLVLFD